MKLFKCYVKEVTTREGFLFVEARSLKRAKDVEWAKNALDEMDYDEISKTKVDVTLESVEEVTCGSQIPENMHASYPWYDPQNPYSEERSLGDWVEPLTIMDTSESLEHEIKLRNKELERIQSELDMYKRLLKKNKDECPPLA